MFKQQHEITPGLSVKVKIHDGVAPFREWSTKTWNFHQLHIVEATLFPLAIKCSTWFQFTLELWIAVCLAILHCMKSHLDLLSESRYIMVWLPSGSDQQRYDVSTSFMLYKQRVFHCPWGFSTQSQFTHELWIAVCLTILWKAWAASVCRCCRNWSRVGLPHWSHQGFDLGHRRPLGPTSFPRDSYSRSTYSAWRFLLPQNHFVTQCEATWCFKADSGHLD